MKKSRFECHIADMAWCRWKTGVERALSVFFAIALTACTTTTTGSVKDDTTLTGETARLNEAGAEYRGPEYKIGILTFENKTPSKVLGIGEAATTILQTQLVAAGLKPVLVDKATLNQQRKFADLQESGVLKTGKKRADEGFDAVDYRLSGAITAYSEVEEGLDALIYQSKSRVARVTVDYALVDLASGVPLVAESGAGEYRKKTTGVLGVGAKSSHDPNLRDGALRDALAKAMNKMIAKLSKQPVSGTVLLVEGGSLVLRLGERSRLAEGTEMTVFRPGAELRDPETGELLGRKQSQVGTVKITSHQNERLSDAAVVSGDDLKVGDIVKVAQ